MSSLRNRLKSIIERRNKSDATPAETFAVFQRVLEVVSGTLHPDRVYRWWSIGAVIHGKTRATFVQSAPGSIQ